MSMTIIVLCPNGRRQPVKVTPNSSILEVLEEACRKQGINANDYDVSHYNKRLDLSLSVRFANLPNNALLELNPVKKARTDGPVTVAVQLESGERFTKDFPPSATMFDIIQTCCGDSLNAAQSSLIEPVCIYMRQRFTGDEINNTTLRSLGLTSGKAVIRLIYRPLESLQEQAHFSIPLPKVQSPVEEVLNHSTRKVASSTDINDHVIVKHPRLDTGTYDNRAEFEQTISQDNACVGNERLSPNQLSSLEGEQQFGMESSEPMQCENNPSVPNSFLKEGFDSGVTSVTQNESEVMDSESLPELAKEIGEIKYLGIRNAVLFNLEDIQEVKKEDFPPEFYELTVNDVLYLMEEYKKTRHDLENEPLMLKSQRESRILQQLTCYKQSVIRIYFPEKLVLQGTFFAEETVQDVMNFVRKFLEDESLDFYLYIAPPRVILPLKQSLLEARLVPAAVVYFGCTVLHDSYLHIDFRSQISDPRAARYVANSCRQKVISNVAADQSAPSSETMIDDISQMPSVSSQPIEQSSIRRSYTPSSQQKVPKWFKIGN